jgi:hypothetical protein
LVITDNLNLTVTLSNRKSDRKVRVLGDVKVPVNIAETVVVILDINPDMVALAGGRAGA